MATLKKLHVEDKIVTISVTGATDLPLDLTEYVAFGVLLQVGNYLIKKYSYPAKTGDGIIKPITLSGGIFDIQIYRQDEYKAPAGNVFYQLYVYETDADFLDDKFKTVGEQIEIYTLLKNPNLKNNDSY